MGRRTTHRSRAGRKLYAKRNDLGQFRDIQRYSRAQAADMRHHAKAEQVTEHAWYLSNCVAKTLNLAIVGDQKAMQAIIEYRVACHIPDENKTNVVEFVDGSGKLTLGALGLINGALIAMGLPRLKAMYTDDGQLVDFSVWVPKPKAKPKKKK